MNNRGNILVSLLGLALGAAFIWLYDRANLVGTLVVLTAVAFIVPAALSLLALFFSKRSMHSSSISRAIQAVCTIGGLALGIVILIMPDVFRGLLVFLFGALLIMGAATQVIKLTRRLHRGDFPTWLFFSPILVLITAVVLIAVPSLHDAANEALMVLISGIAFVVYGLTGLMLSIFHKKIKPTPEAAPAPTDESAAPAAEIAEKSTTAVEHAPVADATDAEKETVADA